MTALTHDIGKMSSKERVDFGALLVAASRESGRSPIAIGLDYAKLRRLRGKLRFYEYILYGLFDPQRFSPEDRARFISAHRHWPLVNACNAQSWWAVTEDKWLSSVFLRQNDIPIPRNAAIFDRGQRLFPDVPKLQSAEGLRDFLTSCETYPLFAKPVVGMWSAGAMRIAGCTDTHVLVDGQEPVTFEHLADDHFGNEPYLIQECLKPHSFFDGITGATATVRCLNLIGQGGLSVPFTLLKLPRHGNVADNFWRPGNLLCDLDPKTGEVRAIVAAQDGRRRPLDGLPDGDRKLIGERLPLWNDIKALNKRVALLHGVNRFGSTDIALTKDGPVVVEVNNGCAFELVQMATGQGFLTDEIIAFFGECGAKL